MLNKIVTLRRIQSHLIAIGVDAFFRRGPWVRVPAGSPNINRLPDPPSLGGSTIFILSPSETVRRQVSK